LLKYKNLSLHIIAVCGAFAFSATITRAQNSVPNSSASVIQIIPQPKKVEPRAERFALTRAARIVLADARAEDDRFAADDFIADARETANVELRTGRSFGHHSILIGALDNAKIRAALERINFSPPADLNDEGYLLSVGEREVIVAGKSAAGTFYGLQTLKQMVRGAGAGAFIQGARVVDYPTMRWRGVSDDISRGPVPTVDYIKHQIKTLAAFKLNMHSFYMEHVLENVEHPLTSPLRGALTPDEAREIVAYARRYHVEIVPEQQTFGHLHKVLKFEQFDELAETPYGDVLSPQAEKTYQLIADWYREINEIFPGKFFHIGADETFELGEGQSREMVKQRGLGAVYFEHIKRVDAMLKPYHRRLMMWGDIALNHPDLIKEIPRDVVVMNWTYTPRDSYAVRIKPFKDAGLEQFVCPGVQSWNQIFPNTDAATINVNNFVRDGQQAGALGMLNTVWRDDGETLFEMSWYGIVFGAAASWQDAPVDVKTFERDFDWAFFRSEGDTFVRAVRALGNVNMLLAVSSTDNLFWQDPFTSDFQRRARAMDEKTKRMRAQVEAAEDDLRRDKNRARRNRLMIDEMIFAAARFDHLGRRMEVAEQFSRDYWDAYLHLDERRRVGRLRRYTGNVTNNLREMAEELAELRAQYRQLWLAENRPYWLDSLLARYDLAIAQWLSKSKSLENILRKYEESSILPNPEEFGLGARPERTDAPRN
jgi:hexosaminidase